MASVKTYKMIKRIGSDKIPYWTLYRYYDENPMQIVWLYGNLSYDKVKTFYDEIMAREAYIPVVVTPPFPDTDPTATFKRKFFKWF